MAVNKSTFDGMKEILLNHIIQKMDYNDDGFVAVNGYPMMRNAIEDLVESMINHGRDLHRCAHGLAILKESKNITQGIIYDAKTLCNKGIENSLNLTKKEEEW